MSEESSGRNLETDHRASWRHVDSVPGWGRRSEGFPGVSRPPSCSAAPPGAAPAPGTGTGGAAGAPGTIAAAAAAGPSAHPEVAA